MKKTLLAFFVVAACAAGQIRITGLEGLAAKAKESVDITLDSNLLGMVSGMLGSGKDKDDQKKAKALLEGLKAITVRTFEFDSVGQYKTEDLAPIREQLRAPGWSRIISTVEKDETAEVFTKTEQGKIAGIAIIAAEAKELAIIVIEGTIDLAELANFGGQFGIPDISNIPGLKQNLKQNPKGKEEE